MTPERETGEENDHGPTKLQGEYAALFTKIAPYLSHHPEVRSLLAQHQAKGDDLRRMAERLRRKRRRQRSSSTLDTDLKILLNELERRSL